MACDRLSTRLGKRCTGIDHPKNATLAARFDVALKCLMECGAAPGHNGGMLELHDIEAAAARLSAHVLDTPFVASRTLSQLTGCEVFLKFENLQYTASFKERGA
jgi:hypothetical protein